jgi:hypothetical protein
MSARAENMFWAPLKLEEPSPMGRRLTTIIVAGLTAWGLCLALGAYLFNHNPWRALIVLGCFAGFVGCWWLLLRSRPRTPLNGGLRNNASDTRR